MKKISLIFKEASESRIKTALKESDSLFIINYSGLKSPDMSSLRLTLRGSKANLFVAKNSVARRALKDSSLEGIVKLIDGPCGLIFIKDEPVGISKLLCDFAKKNEALKLEGGLLKDRVIEKKDIEALSKLPSKEQLRAQVVVALNSPILRLALVLNQNLRKLVYCLDQIKQKKGS